MRTIGYRKNIIDCQQTTTSFRRIINALETVPTLSNEITNTPTLHKDLRQSDSFSFCSWKNCAAENGGAIYFHDNSGSLTVSDCLFENCNCTSGHGGAIYGCNCGKVSIQRANFMSCTAEGHCCGGGLLIQSSPSVPNIFESTFISCSAGEDGGGLYLYQITGTNGVTLPVNNCLFISCIANGQVTWTVENEADGGGIIFWENARTLGISNTLFTKCESKNRAGGSFFTINSDHFDGIIRFCFYSENTAEKGRNALVHFYIADDTLWPTVFFHSFTSDSDLSDSLIKDYPDVKEVTHNWLPHVTFLFIQDCCSNVSTHATVTQRKSEIIIDEGFSQFSGAFYVVVKFTVHDSLSLLQILPSLNV